MFSTRRFNFGDLIDIGFQYYNTIIDIGTFNREELNELIEELEEDLEEMKLQYERMEE